MSIQMEDNSDFQDAHAGQIKILRPDIIYSAKDDGKVIWDNEAYNWIRGDDVPETVNSSLWRQSKLCRIQGLFKIADYIYQVRGLDLANITFVETPNNGVIVIDCLTCYETAKTGWKLYHEERPDRIIRALIYTHCHADHFGGAVAIVEAAPKDPKLPIFSPDGFLEHAVSENIYARNAMGRRSVYMYGTSLESSPTGQVRCGLGMNISSGKTGLVQPTDNIKKTGFKHTIDGLDVVFQVTPGTEAPAEMNFHFPQYRALCMAENLTHTMHNIQTLRGALVRDARMWSRYLDEALVLFGNETDIVFASHHWPTFGNENILRFMAEQRDLYAYLNNETLRLLNAGQTCLEIAEDFVLPPSLDKLWNSRGYYGSTSHNVKAGWFDGNPAHLWEHPPKAAAERYVRCIGGTGPDALDIVINKGIDYRNNGDLRFSATLLSHAVFADQTNQTARQELATTYQKLGYGAENATWRNIYLVGAQELLSPITPATVGMSAEALQALSVEQLTDTMAIRVEGAKAWDFDFTIDFFIADEQSGWHMNLNHGALTGHTIDYVASRAALEQTNNLTIWLTRAEFVGLITGAKSDLAGLNYTGDSAIWEKLVSTLVTLDPGFAIVTPEPVTYAK